MQTVAYLLPKRGHTTWNPALEPLDMAPETGVEIPLIANIVRYVIGAALNPVAPSGQPSSGLSTPSPSMSPSMQLGRSSPSRSASRSRAGSPAVSHQLSAIS